MYWLVNRNQIGIVLILGWTLCSSAWAQRSIPALSGPVVDHANILSATTEREVNELILVHQESTSNQLAVLTIPSLEGETLEAYSLRVARQWRLGQADRNNGVLLLIAVAERSIRIEVGYGLEGDLPDIYAKRIINQKITPLFRENNFDGGVRQGVTAILQTIEGTYSPAQLVSTGDLVEGGLLIFLPLLFIGSFILQPGSTLWTLAIFMVPLVSAGGYILFPPHGWYIVPAILALILIGVRIYLNRSTKWSRVLAAIAKASPGDSVPISIGKKTFTYKTPGKKSRGRSAARSYRGRGGSFGGGGASGRW